jgi:hypothetical protein
MKLDASLVTVALQLFRLLQRTLDVVDVALPALGSLPQFWRTQLRMVRVPAQP